MVMKKGNELYHLFVELTGLEQGTIESELRALMQRLNMNPETLSTDDIRRLMAAYLDEFHTEFISPKVDAPIASTDLPEDLLANSHAEA